MILLDSMTSPKSTTPYSPEELKSMIALIKDAHCRSSNAYFLLYNLEFVESGISKDEKAVIYSVWSLGKGALSDKSCPIISDHILTARMMSFFGESWDYHILSNSYV